MSWLSRITNRLGGVFGDPSLGDEISDFLPDISSSLTSSKDGKDSSLWSGTNSLWGPLINAGTGLAGTYFQQSNSKDMAEAYAKQQEAALAEAKRQFDINNQTALAAIGAQSGAARRNTLANLYNNWANLTERGGEAGSQTALGTGRQITDAINARAAVLR